MTKTMGDKKRFFTIVSSSFGITGGRYISVDPIDAGRKAGREAFKKADAARMTSRSNHIVFVQMVEKTRFNKVSHPKERYYYRVTRITIPEAKRKEFKFKGNTFSPKYDYKCEKVELSDFPADHRGGM